MRLKHQTYLVTLAWVRAWDVVKDGDGDKDAQRILYESSDGLVKKVEKEVAIFENSNSSGR